MKALIWILVGALLVMGAVLSMSMVPLAPVGVDLL